MGERNLDFDTVINRKGTKCLKHDFAKQRGIPEDNLSMWVADMDFKVSSYVEDALVAQATHAVYGYTDIDADYFEVVKNWVKNHYGWDVKPEWHHKSPGVVFGISTAVRAYTEKGDAVLIQQPVYYPFAGVIRDNKRKMVVNNLVYDGEGHYTIDYEDFENKIVDNDVKLFILCNPHNPVGKVWGEEELKKLGDICKKHGVIVFADEIHADFVWKGSHHSFVTVDESFGEFSVVATSPSKTFNIAGLQVSNLFIPNKELHSKFKEAFDSTGYCELNAAGIVAAEAAYRHGEEWYQAMKKYVRANIDYIGEFVAERLPGVRFIDPEGTYLVWLDFNELGLSRKELDEFIIHKAGLWLDSGWIFGAAGDGFQRINAACPRQTVTECLERIEKALRES